MSKAQGDHYRTHTDHELNAYRARLDNKLHKLIDEKEINFFIKNALDEEFMISCVQGNEIENKNGSWKWNGWEITGRYYRMYLYIAGDYDRESGRVHDLPIFCFTQDTNKDIANAHFKDLAEMAKNYSTEELISISPTNRFVV